jgi:hypothetical protein
MISKYCIHVYKEAKRTSLLRNRINIIDLEKVKRHKKIFVFICAVLLVLISSSYTLHAQNSVTNAPAVSPASGVSQQGKSDSVRVAKKESAFTHSLINIFHNPFKKKQTDTSASAKKKVQKADSAKATDYARKSEKSFLSSLLKGLGIDKGTAAIKSKEKTVQGIDTSKSGKPKNDSISKAKNDSASKAATANHAKSFISKLDKMSSHGSISAGYDYGVLPFASNMQVPMGYFHSEGQGQFSLGSLPFMGSYYYSDLQSISGLNNYFRVAFDAQKFKEQYLGKIAQEEQAVQNKLMQAYKGRQLAEQKLLYLTSLPNMGQVKLPTTPSPLSTPALPGTGVLQQGESTIKTAVADSLAKDEKGLKSDTVNGPKLNGKGLKSDSTALAKSAKSSLAKDTAGLGKNDTVKTAIARYVKLIEKYDKDIEKFNKEINTLKNTAKAWERTNPYLSKLYNLMGGVKKLEIGLCYPDYSSFLASGMAVKGVNIEYYRDDIFVAVTEGTTVNTLLFTNNTLQNKLLNTPNPFNMFDFSSVQNGRKIVSGMIGIGAPDNTHLYIGMLYGTGLPSYITSTNSTVINTSLPDGLSKNVVLEVDGMWKISSNSTFSLAYGKSSTTTTTSNGIYTTDGGLFNSIESRAFLGKYQLKLPITNTTLTFTGRYVDPYFNSFGLGYLRADNFRYEGKVEQALSKKIKVSVFYRKDEDDFLQLYQYRTVLQTLGANTTVKLMRSLNLRVSYTPVVEKMYDLTNPSANILNHNSICNAVLTYSPIIHNVTSTFTLSYNYYKITSDTQTMAFQNFSFSNMTRFKNSFSNTLTLAWFKATPTDSLNNDVWMLTDQVDYTFKHGLKFGIGGTSAYNPLSHTWQYGYLAKLTIPLIKHFSCELMVEKLVLGNFYDSFDILQIERFPYFGQAKLIMTW